MNIKKSPKCTSGASGPISSLNVIMIPVIAIKIANTLSGVGLSFPSSTPRTNVITGCDVKTIDPRAAVVCSSPAANDNGKPM